jgi:hypothetical protein
MNREIIYSSLSPNKEWNLVILSPSAESPNFYAQIRHVSSKETHTFSFGISAALNECKVEWDLPKDVCGLFVAQNCYGMFYYGTGQRSKPRYRARTSPKDPFSIKALADFGNVNLIHYETWEGVYPIPDLHAGKCSWCTKEHDNFWVVLFEGVSETVEIQSEIVCNLCIKSASEFIKMRKQGHSRKSILKDFGFR